MTNKTVIFCCSTILGIAVVSYFAIKFSNDVSSQQKQIDYDKAQESNLRSFSCQKLCPQYPYEKDNECCKGYNYYFCQYKPFCFNHYIFSQESDLTKLQVAKVIFIILDVGLGFILVGKLCYDLSAQKRRLMEQDRAQSRALMAAMLERRQNPSNLKAQNRQQQKHSILTSSFIVQDRTQNCAVCLEDFDEVKVVSLNCLHLFHRRCIENWLNKGDGSCPVCRAPHSQVMEQYHVYGQE